MGNARWDNVSWTAHAQATSSMSRDEIFTGDRIDISLDPAQIKKREACDSDANPNSTPIILASDVTGSMGFLAEQMIKTNLGTIMREIYDRKAVTDPAIMCAAIGDMECDSAPLQVTQFESSVEPLVQQLAKVYIEAGGGGNGWESYPGVWAFAAYKTRCDAIKKRKRKGYLFTIGDECPCPTMTRDRVKRFLGLDAQSDMNSRVLLADLRRDWHVFHLMVKPVIEQPVVKTWKEWLGQCALEVKDVSTLAAGIVAILQYMEGADASDVHKGWSGEEGLVVRDVTAQLVSTSS